MLLLTLAHDEPTAHKHPIHAALCTERSCVSSWLQLRMRSPANWESLEKRLRSLDPSSGCFDPTELGTAARPNPSRWQQQGEPSWKCHSSLPWPYRYAG